VARLDLFPNLSLPTPLTSYITFTPRVGLRGTFYSRGAKGIKTDAVTRGLVELGAELSTRLFRIFPVEGERLQAIRHTVEPSIGYLYIPEVDQDDIPQIDSTDFISPQNRLFLSLNNRFSASVRDPDGTRRRFDFFTFTLGTSINLDAQTRTFSDLFLDSLQPEDITQAVEEGPPIPIPGLTGFSKAKERDVANIVYQMSITPPWPVSLDMSGSLNPEEGKFETTNARLNASYKDIASFSLGYTFSSGANQESVIGTLDLRLFEGAGLSYLGRYDAERGVFTENQVGLIYQTCCWALSIIYTRRDTENPDDPTDDIRVNVELLTAPTQRID
jgi:lipopolysaccharide assembly outer membrane protein LptD (OstA)